MPKIKTRDQIKEIKTPDKSALIRHRIMTGLIRSKEKVLRDKREKTDTSPGQYAETTVQNVAAKTGQLGTYSAKLAVLRGRQIVQKRRIKQAEEELRRERVPMSENKTSTELQSTAGEQAAAEARPASSSSFTHKFSETQPVPLQFVERGRELEREQTVRRAEQTRRIRNRRLEDVGIPENSTPLIRQRTTLISLDTSTTKNKGKTFRSIKTPQHTDRATIKTPQVLERTLKDSAARARIAAQAAKVSTKAAAAKARAVTKSIPAATKTLITTARTSFLALFSGSWVVVLIVVVAVLFGGILALFGDSAENNAYTPVSAEVDAYTPMIQLYAEKYGIPDYVDLIKAIMMTESGGKGGDPMQASESGFNTRYPRKPKAITDPEYSIDVGVQTIASVLKQAKVESPLDLERIKLALQGYNFGNGYISWALDKYGGYSESNTIEFSQMMAKRLGWSRYGSTKYVSVVLQYYPFGYKFPTGDGDYIWPLPGYTRISSPFGYRNCPYHGRELHGGVDLPAPYGTNILAAKSGTVVLSAYGSSFGNHVAVSHADGSRTMYCHMSKRLVSVGDTVVQGQVIGLVGSTGNSTGNHLHFELWTNGNSSSRTNPMDYF